MATSRTSAVYRQGVLAAATGLAASVASTITFCRSDEKTSNQKSKLIFLGTGSSTGCPKPLCNMLFNKTDTPNHISQSVRDFWEPRCKVSNLAIEGDPKTNKNYRNNPSLLINHYDNKDRSLKNIVIDTGKTFREASLRWMPMHGISSLDGIVLTHQHMDAAAGLDDVRGFQTIEVLGKDSSIPYRRIPTPVYLSQFTLDELSKQFHWLFPKHQPPKKSPSSTGPVVHRDVAAFDVHVFYDFEPFEVAGLKMTPLPVWHGDDLICHGFAFTINNVNIVYLSDISRMIPKTLEHIRKKLPPTDILVVDALLLDRLNPVHFNLDQAIELIENMQPKQAFLVGMNCDSFLPHEEMNRELAKRKRDGINAQFAHDGMVIHL